MNFYSFMSSTLKNSNFGQFDLRLPRGQDKVTQGLGHGGLRPRPPWQNDHGPFKA
jgi:hypothetical protein